MTTASPTSDTLHHQLIDAVRRASIADIDAALNAGADVHANHDIALRVACSDNHTDIALHLIQSGADIQADNNYPLRMAARYGNMELALPLLDAGADIEDSGALDAASLSGHVDMVRLLMERDGPPPCTTEDALSWMQEKDCVAADMTSAHAL